MTDPNEHERQPTAGEVVAAFRATLDEVAPVLQAGIEAIRSVLEATVTAMAPSLAKLRADLERIQAAQRAAGKRGQDPFRHRGQGRRR